MPKVFVTGANGFIAQHVVKQLLEKKYTVVGSVRSKEKGDLLDKNFGGNFSYEVVADITSPGSFNKALEKHADIVGFFHTASPVHFCNENFEENIIVPAIDGTKNVLASVHEKCKDVKKFIFTSSFAAVNSKEQTKDFTMTEETWNQVGRNDATNGMQAYSVSKTYAEKAVWEFKKTHKPNFVINTVNPSMVFGPQAFDANVKETLNSSSEIVNSFLKLKSDDPVPGVAGGFIDVRDVARAHVLAFEKDISDQRLLTTQERYTGQMLLDIIHSEFPQLSALPVGEPGTTREILEGMAKIDNSKSRNLVGPFIPLQKSLFDTIEQILKFKSNL